MKLIAAILGIISFLIIGCYAYDRWGDWQAVVAVFTFFLIVVMVVFNMLIIEKMGHTIETAKNSIKANELSSNMNLLRSTLNEYGSEEMYVALKYLGDFLKDCKKNKVGIAKKYRQLSLKNNDLIESIHLARRRVKYYFSSAEILLDADLISPEIFARITDFSGKRLLFEIVEPLDFMGGKPESPFDKKLFDRLANAIIPNDQGLENREKRLNLIERDWEKVKSLYGEELNEYKDECKDIYVQGW